MKRLRYITLLCLITLGIAQAQPLKPTQFSFTQAKGKWLVINYWANWCKPCIQEMPQLEALYKAHKDNLVVVGVNFDKLPLNLQNIIAHRLHISYPLVNTNPADQYGIRHIDVLPTTAIITPQGRLKVVLVGPQTRKSIEKVIGLS